MARHDSRSHACAPRPRLRDRRAVARRLGWHPQTRLRVHTEAACPAHPQASLRVPPVSPPPRPRAPARGRVLGRSASAPHTDDAERRRSPSPRGSTGTRGSGSGSGSGTETRAEPRQARSRQAPWVAPSNSFEGACGGCLPGAPSSKLEGATHGFHVCRRGVPAPRPQFRRARDSPPASFRHGASPSSENRGEPQSDRQRACLSGRGTS
jgi:hypothetical protein